MRNTLLTMDEQERLPNTLITNKCSPGSVNGNLAVSFPGFQCINQETGQFMGELYFGGSEATHALTGSDLNGLNCVGGAIGSTAQCIGVVADVCANTTDNPTIRMAAMGTADVCMTTGSVIVYTPGVSTLLGAAVMGEPISSATVTTALLAWVCAAPVSTGQAMCFYLLCNPKESNPLPVLATRFNQYRTVNDRRVENQTRAAHANVML